MMKRYLYCLLLGLLAAWPSGDVWSQSTPPPVAPVAPTPPAPTTPPDTHVRRHRMGDGSIRRLDTDTEFRAALQAHIEELRAQVAEIEDRLQQEHDQKLEDDLAKLQEELSTLDSLKPLDLPDVVVDPDHSKRVLWNRQGNEVVILDPDSGPAHKTHGAKVVYLTHLYVNHDDWIDGSAVAILGNVHVLGHVEEDVVSIGGNVYVDGTVAGNVVAPFGDVVLNGDAYVEGDVVAVSVSADDQAQIGGTIEEIPLFRLPWVNDGAQALLKLAATVVLAKFTLVLLLGLLITAVVPQHVTRVEERLKGKPISSFFGGVLVQIMIFPVFVLLLVTVIGIPLALLALPLLVLASLMLGFVALARMLGNSLLHQGGPKSPSLRFGVGALILFSPLLVAALVTLSNSELGDSVLLGVNLLFFLGLCVLYLVYTAGMGAAAFSRLGTRALGASRARATAISSVPLSPPPSALPQAPPAIDAS
jgi:hypothetical protein